MLTIARYELIIRTSALHFASPVLNKGYQMLKEHKHGPFLFKNDGFISDTSIKRGMPTHIVSREWEMIYNGQVLATHVIPGPDFIISELLETFEPYRNAFIAERQKAFLLPRIDLVDEKSRDVLASFHSENTCEMLPNPINDNHQYWMCSEDRLLSRGVTLTHWGQIVAENIAPENAWITSLLPNEVLTNTPSDWRAPSSWELRTIVGEGSFTGISGAKAAELVGVSPQNFRKYTAREEAATHQKMSFAMWHLLLQKLKVKNA